MPILSRRLKSLDYTFLLVIGLILALNLLVLSSATVKLVPADPLSYVKRQVLWIVLGLIAAGFITFSFDYSKLHRWHHVIYGTMIALLLVVKLAGHRAMGAQRQIDFGAFVFQPSELAKIMIIVCFASYLSRRQGEIKHFKDLIPCILYFAVPLGLIVKQDLGTSLVFVVIFFGMLYLAGARPSLLLGVIGCSLAVVALALGLHFSPLQMWLPLQNWQLARLVTFLDPYSDPTGDGYHIIQSLVAIGSGGFWGKGLYHGTQVQLNFLPERQTDFIFSVIGEELGFLGAGILLILYFNMINRTLSMAFQSRDSFGRLMLGGIICMWLFHILENIGMTIGVMPITGIPLPFMSYGGSFMLTNMIAVGLILNVHMRHELMLF